MNLSDVLSKHEQTNLTMSYFFLPLNAAYILWMSFCPTYTFNTPDFFFLFFFTSFAVIAHKLYEERHSFHPSPV